MDASFTIKRGDLLRDVVIVASDSVGPVDLDGVTATFRMVNVLTGAVAIEAGSAVAADSIPFTASGANISATAHGLNNGEEVTGKSTGVLPGNLSTQTRYFVVNASVNGLQLALVKGGTPITTSNAGSGTHALLSGRLTYPWQTGETNTGGTYHAEFITLQSGEPFSYPNTDPFVIEILSPTEWGERGVAIRAVRDRVLPNVEPALTQGEIEREVDRARLVRVWEPDTAYRINDVVVPVNRNGWAYSAMQPGTSKAGSYNYFDWPQSFGWTIGDGTSDPQLIWEAVGTDRFNGSIAGAETNIYDIGKACQQLWLIKARKCSEFVDEGDTSFEQMYKHCMEQAAMFRPFTRPVRMVTA
jgi:hypothetical protein